MVARCLRRPEYEGNNYARGANAATASNQPATTKADRLAKKRSRSRAAASRETASTALDPELDVAHFETRATLPATDDGRTDDEAGADGGERDARGASAEARDRWRSRTGKKKQFKACSCWTSHAPGVDLR